MIFHLDYRYLCLHWLFQSFQHGLRHAFANAGMLPYQFCIAAELYSFGIILDARLLSTPDRSTSELLRTL